VRGDSVGDAVGLPDVHLVTAGASASSAGVIVVGGSGPALNVGFAVDELDVLGALSVAVSSTVLGTGLVGGGKTTICGHGHEVEGAVETASNLADIDVKRELLVLQVEHLVVLVLLVHKVDTGANIAAGLELKAQRVARCLDAVGTRVVGTVKGAVRRTSGTVRAQSLVPGVASVAVG